MPLSHIALILNSFNQPGAGGIGPEFRFVSAGRRVVACYGDLRLKSRFIPLQDAQAGGKRGHRAVLAATRLDSPAAVAADEVYALAPDEAGVVELDRRIRTLHALNYLLHPAPGALLLSVHPCARPGADWSLAFEDILRPCGLVPERIVLEIGAGALGGSPLPAPGTAQRANIHAALQGGAWQGARASFPEA